MLSALFPPAIRLRLFVLVGFGFLVFAPASRAGQKAQGMQGGGEQDFMREKVRASVFPVNANRDLLIRPALCNF